MKERHKRKEIYSFILVSNMDNTTRQISISAVGLKCLIGFGILICIGVGIIVYSYFVRDSGENKLKKQIISTEESMAALQEEVERLKVYGDSLSSENQRLLKKIEQLEEKKEEEEIPKTAYPQYYPLEQGGELLSTFSETEPYLGINVQRGNHVIATGDGVVRLVDYHEGYVHSIEIEHVEGYFTRYFCDKEAEVLVTEGDEVKQRDYLLGITSDNTKLHYQVILDNSPLNPFEVIGGEN